MTRRWPAQPIREEVEVVVVLVVFDIGGPLSLSVSVSGFVVSLIHSIMAADEMGCCWGWDHGSQDAAGALLCALLVCGGLAGDR